MSVSQNLLCSFELLKPLDSTALKSHIKKGRNQRNSMINSPVSVLSSSHKVNTNSISACTAFSTKFLDHLKQLISPLPISNNNPIGFSRARQQLINVLGSVV